MELSPGAASVQGKLSHDVTFYVDGRLARRRVGEHGDSDCSRGFKVAEDEISLFVFENTKSTGQYITALNLNCTHVNLR